jgi:two-component system response regulator FixJ
MNAARDRRVYIIDDDHQVRTMIRRMVTSAGIYSQEFGTAAQFLEAHSTLPRGCILLDLRLPQMSGLELLRQLKELHDRSPVVMISGQADVPDAVDAIKLGAFDFIQKPFQKERLLEVIGEAFAYLFPSDGKRELPPAEPLTRRELDVIRILARGGSNKDVARELDLSTRTVEMHRANILAKLGAKSATQAVLMARDEGIL